MVFRLRDTLLGLWWTTLSGPVATRKYKKENYNKAKTSNLHTFREKFGLHSVDFNDPSRPRTPKESAKYMGKLAAANAFIESDGPCNNG